MFLEPPDLDGGALGSSTPVFPGDLLGESLFVPVSVPDLPPAVVVSSPVLVVEESSVLPLLPLSIGEEIPVPPKPSSLLWGTAATNMPRARRTNTKSADLAAVSFMMENNYRFFEREMEEVEMEGSGGEGRRREWVKRQLGRQLRESLGGGCVWW